LLHSSLPSLSHFLSSETFPNFLDAVFVPSDREEELAKCLNDSAQKLFS
jgi:hypothetical protein